MTNSWNGFFSTFGFVSPALKEVQKINELSSEQKIKRDIAKINEQYQNTFLEFKKRLLR